MHPTGIWRGYNIAICCCGIFHPVQDCVEVFKHSLPWGHFRRHDSRGRSNRRWQTSTSRVLDDEYGQKGSALARPSPRRRVLRTATGKFAGHRTFNRQHSGAMIKPGHMSIFLVSESSVMVILLLFRPSSSLWSRLEVQGGKAWTALQQLKRINKGALQNTFDCVVFLRTRADQVSVMQALSPFLHNRVLNNRLAASRNSLHTLASPL